MAVRESKTIITAEDRASAVFKSFKNEIEGASKALGAFAAAAASLLLVDKFKSMLNDLVSYRAELEKISVVTGASVENLSLISQAAKLAGTDMGTVEAAMVKLTKGLTASNAETKNTALGLAYLGLSGRDAAGKLRDPGEVMLDIAKKLGGMADGSNKAAVMLAIFGKAGAQLNPVMKELYVNGDLLVKTTSEQAFQAHEYEKSLVKLGIAQGNIGKKIMGEMIVPLTTLLDMYKDHITETGSLNAAVNKLSKEGDLQGWAEYAGYAIATLVDGVRLAVNTIMALSGSVKAVYADLKVVGAGFELAHGIINIDEFKNVLAQRNETLADANAGYQTLLNLDIEQTRNAYEKQLKITKDAFAKRQAEAAAQNLANAGRAEFKGLDHADPQQKENMYRTENAQLDMQIQKLQNIGELEIYITKLSENRFDKLTTGERAALIAKEKYKIALEREASQRKFDLSENEKNIEAAKLVGDAMVKATSQIEDEIDKLKFEATTIGLTNDQRQIALLLLEKEIALRGQTDAQVRRDIKTLSDEKLALVEKIQAGGKELSLWNEIADKGSKLFTDMATSGKNAFSTLKDAFKSFGREMLAFFAKRYILQMAAGATGSSGLAAQAAGMDSGSGLVGAAVNGLSSLVGGTGGISATITAALAAIPVWGWIAIAALAAYAAFGGKGGGPKVEGSYMGNYGADGKLIDENSHRFFVNHDMDSASKKVSEATAQSYTELVSRFGGTAGNTTFGFGSDSDPRGTAQNRVSGNAWVNGHEVFMQRDREIGRDNSKIGEEMQLTAQRALIAALQATDLPGAIKKLFSGVDAYSITAQAATDLLAKATAYADAFKALKDSLQAIQNQMDGLAGDNVSALNAALKTLRGNVDAAKSAFDATMAGDDPQAQLSAEQVLLNAVTTRYNTEMQMLQTLQDAIATARDGAYQFAQAMAGRYANVGRNVDTSGASQARIAQLQGSIDGTSDPARRLGFVNQALGAIDNWVTSSRSAVQRDFASRQTQMQAELQGAQAIADARKKAIQTQIDGLNESIKLAGAFKSLAQQAQQAMTQMSQSGANPLSVQGRLGLAGDSVQNLLSQFRGSSGQGRIDSANQLMQQLQGRMALGGEALQRPSDAYQKIYNEVMSTYAEIRDSALSETQQSLAVQQKIADLTQQQVDIDKNFVAYQATQIDLTSQMNAALDAINAQAIAQYEIYDAIGRAAFDQQEKIATDQLNAITGGMNVAMYTAQLQTQTRDLLVQIRDALTGPPGPITVTIVLPGGGPTGGGPTGGGPTGGGPTGGGPRRTGESGPIILTEDDVRDIVLQTATQLRREMSRA